MAVFFIDPYKKYYDKLNSASGLVSSANALKDKENKYSYQKNSSEIFRVTQKEWVCVWSRTKKQKN